MAASLILTTLVLAGVYGAADRMLARSAEAAARARAAATAAPYASSLSNAINERLNLVRGLVALVTAQAGQPDFDTTFTIYAEEIRRNVHGIRNIGIAPDFVVRHINPVQGNEATLGHAFLKDPRPGFVEEVYRAIATRDIVTHGPLPLIQGGQGLIARHAVVVEGRVWGAVGVVFDLQPILDKANLEGLAAEHDYAIRQGNGALVAGNPAVFDRAPVIGTIRLPDGTWELGLVPRVGWTARQDGLFTVLFLGAALLLQLVLFLALDRFFALMRRLQEREESEARLRQARDAAEEAAAAKSRFLAAASHDLRQPVHTLRLLLSAMESEGGSLRDPEVADVLHEMKLAAEILSDMLHTFLDVSRLDAGVIVPQFKDCALGPLLGRILPQFQHLAATQDVRLRMVPTSLSVQSDPALLARILGNLVHNAIKFSAGGAVLVGCRRRQGQILIQVWDTGVGIAPDMHEAIFEEFRQLGNDARQRELGLGLGLNIAKRISLVLQCNLYVKSRVGKGSVFTLAIPAMQSL